MLKFVFGCLLAVNAGLLFYQVGWLDALVSSGHEPQRLKNQINADKLRVLSPQQGAAVGPGMVPAGSAAATAPPVPAAAPAAPATPPAPAAPAPQGTAVSTATTVPAVTPVVARAAAAAACVELGNLSTAEARRFETRLAELKWTPAPARRETRESSSHMVWIPPLPSGKEGADRKSAELRKLGVSEFFVLQDNPAQRFGISLGVFKTEDAARAHLAKLSQQGVKSARLVEHRMPLVRASFQFASVDDKARVALMKLKDEFPRAEEKACAA